LIFSTKSSDFGITEHICSPIMRVSMVSNDVFLSPCLPSVLYIQYTAFPTSLIISSVEVRFQQRMPCDYNHYRFSCATTLPPRTTSYHLVRACAIARRTRDLPHQPHQNRDFSAHTLMRYSKQLKY
jgi:hypothetical protein